MTEFVFRRIGDKYFVMDGSNETLALIGPDGFTAKPGVLAQLDNLCGSDETLVDYIKRQCVGPSLGGIEEIR